LYEETFNAALILTKLGVPYSPGNPYVNGTIINQTSFVGLGSADIYSLIMEAHRLSMNAAWWIKYHNLLLRPEELGYQLQRTLTGDPIDINSELLTSPVLQRIFNKYGTYLLPGAYREGCPCHPSYVSGHSVCN